MQSDATHSTDLYTLWAWFDKNRQQVMWGAGVAAVAALLVWFIVWRQGEKEVAAGEALSRVGGQLFGRPGPHPGEAEAYLRVAATYPGSSAGARALLLGAGAFFDQGKYEEARAQFQRFIQQHHDSPFLPEALLGIASCLDAQGKTNDAFTAYRDLVEHYPEATIVGQAKFGLAQLYVAQNKPDMAYNYYEDVKRADPYGALGDEALFRSRDLELKYPNLAPKPAMPATPMLSLPKKQ